MGNRAVTFEKSGNRRAASTSNSTIPQASVGYAHPTGDPIGIVSMRLVIDVGAWDETRVVIAGGQSGNPLSPHYDDMIETWRRGEAVSLAWSPEAIDAAAVKTLRLVPGAP